MSQSIVETRLEMVKLCMKKDVFYSRKEITTLFWVSYPLYCAKLLLKSPVDDRPALQILEGIISFDKLKSSHNTYSL